MEQGTTGRFEHIVQFGFPACPVAPGGLCSVKSRITSLSSDNPMPVRDVERPKNPEPSIEIQERERQRIAMDLHDGLGQALTLMKLELTNTSRLMAAGTSVNGDAHDSLQRLSGRLHDAFEELRRIVMDLRPSMLDDLGILPTLSWYFREFDASGAGITLKRTISVLEHQVPVSLKVTVFRILQEAVSNAVRHAQADRIEVELSKTGMALNFRIEDNGCGFDVIKQGIFQRSSGGLAGILKRVQMTGGSCAIESQSGKGTRIKASWLCT